MSSNIGGAGALLFMFVPPVVGGVAGGYLVPKHRVLGVVGGAALGFGGMILLSRIISSGPVNTTGGNPTIPASQQNNHLVNPNPPSGA